MTHTHTHTQFASRCSCTRFWCCCFCFAAGVTTKKKPLLQLDLCAWMSVFPPPNYTKLMHSRRFTTHQIQHCTSNQMAKKWLWVCVASALVVRACVSRMYCTCVLLYSHEHLDCFFPCRGLGEGVLGPASACTQAKAESASGWVATSSRGSLLYWIQQNVERQHNGETLRSLEQHNCNKDLASWGIWTPPGDLSWCSPVEKLCTRVNSLMNTSLAVFGFLRKIPNIWGFVHLDAGAKQTADLPPLCFDRIIIPGYWGLCKNTDTSVIFICLRLVALSFLCFFIFGKAELFLSPHEGNLLGNLAFQSTQLNICIT